MIKITPAEQNIRPALFSEPEWRNYLKHIVDSFDDSLLLPTMVGTAGAGAVIGGKDSVAGAIFGGLAGALLHAALKTSTYRNNGQVPEVCIGVYGSRSRELSHVQMRQLQSKPHPSRYGWSFTPQSCAGR